MTPEEAVEKIKETFGDAEEIPTEPDPEENDKREDQS